MLLLGCVTAEGAKAHCTCKEKSLAVTEEWSTQRTLSEEHRLSRVVHNAELHWAVRHLMQSIRRRQKP